MAVRTGVEELLEVLGGASVGARVGVGCWLIDKWG